MIRLPRRLVSIPTVALLAWAAATTAIPARPDRATASSVTTAAFSAANVSLGISLVKSGFSSPVLVTNAGDGSNRLFVVEQTGRIRILKGSTLLATPFLDLHTALTCCGGRACSGSRSTRTTRRFRTST